MKFLKKESVIKDNIISTNIKDNITKKVTDFYKISPFPNYKSNDNKATILEKGDKNLLAEQFKKFIGYNKNVLEVGCGTGQLSIYFSLGTNNNVVGLDPTIESLQLASKFTKDNKIENISFVNADIFEDVLKDEFFDFIWCNGVLHHTDNPYEAFRCIIPNLKKGGYIFVGLYNKFGRFRTKFRKYIYKLFGKKVLIKFDPVLRKIPDNSQDKINAWIKDQYTHPVESTHTFDEILKWFKLNNIEFINSIPESSPFNVSQKNFFEKNHEATFIERILQQLIMIFSSFGGEGGLFIFIGKKKN